MGKMKITYRPPELAGPAAAGPGPSVAPPAAAEPAKTPPAGPEPVLPREVLSAGAAKARALLRLYLHSRKVRAAAKALSAALAESREVSSWPGDRLPVGAAMSDRVERLTRRLKLETEAHNRLEALFKSVDLGRSAAAV
ncbi:hypothetical protein [Arthrobacter sp. AD-310]